MSSAFSKGLLNQLLLLLLAFGSLFSGIAVPQGLGHQPLSFWFSSSSVPLPLSSDSGDFFLSSSAHLFSSSSIALPLPLSKRLGLLLSS